MGTQGRSRAGWGSNGAGQRLIGVKLEDSWGEKRGNSGGCAALWHWPTDWGAGGQVLRRSWMLGWTKQGAGRWGGRGSGCSCPLHKTWQMSWFGRWRRELPFPHAFCIEHNNTQLLWQNSQAFFKKRKDIVSLFLGLKPYSSLLPLPLCVCVCKREIENWYINDPCLCVFIFNVIKLPPLFFF